ncbi:hypothetical protein PKOR_15955 [Pontibacter korlensis]|uniref:Uncharacterized protein n=1 Tax=Pontibacter korlensis TaxID=400092 RepID=A0A0E3ZH88_9BACT|nr:hypothetical protein PKOR_15955 [Pontibacter korlensis]
MVILLHALGGDLLKIIQLRLVDVCVQRDVNPPQPARGGQLQGKVAALLPGCPCSEATLLAELLEKVAEPVIPVMVAGYGIQVRLRRGREDGGCSLFWKSALVRPPQPVMILFAGRGGVYLIAPHQQQVPTPDTGVTKHELPLRQQVSRIVSGVPAVPDIGNIIQPQLLSTAVVIGARLSGGSKGFPLVGIGAKHRGDHHPGGRIQQLDRVEPAHHVLSSESHFPYVHF